MSNPSSERPWSEEEKNTLLTEILKKAGVPSSHLLKIIRDCNITPSWADIPLPPGRSLNSCRAAFLSMYQNVQAPVNQNFGPFSAPRQEPSAHPTASLDSSTARKRPLYPADKPLLAPRAIQPRPTTSLGSFSSESGVSALLSPGLESISARGGEPPRKRGRPSKAESERRKAAAEARGEPYPLPRRAGSNKIKVPSAPTSPATADPRNSSLPPQGMTPRPPPSGPPPEMRYAPPPGRPAVMMVSTEDDRTRDYATREIGPSTRELPRPAEMRQTLPSPQALQLGHREPIARIDPGERPYEPHLPDRMSLMADNNRRSILLPHSGRPDEPTRPTPDVSLRSSIEKRPE